MEPMFYLEHRGLRLRIIRGGDALPITRDRLVKLRDGDEYKIGLQNTLGVKVDARIKIDGKSMGTVQIGPTSNCEIDRPAITGVERKFAFYKEGTEKASKAKIESGLKQNGEVEVTFVVEKERTVFACKSSSWLSGDTLSMGPTWLGGPRPSPVIKCPEISSSDPYMGFSTRAITRDNGKLYSGATVLGKASSQKFVDVPAVTDVDFETTMIVRLVVEADSEEPVAITHYFSNTDFSQPPPRVS